MPSSLLSLVDQRRIMVCAGAGGVGKTTIAAALSLGAAMRGKRVLCMTVDPAKRLADTLGLNDLGDQPQAVAQSRFAELGIAVPGSLSVLVIDTKSTFDELVRRHAPSAEVCDRILQNRLYSYVSTSLAGTQSYMAMEKVLSVKADERFDLVVLDTPPTSDALEFLNAPERLIEALDSPAMRWLVQAFTSSGKLSFNVLARGFAAVLRSVGKLTGRGLLEHMAEFVSELNELFGGFKERARKVSEAFRGSEFAYVIVATPSPMALEEAKFFASRLSDLGMRGDAIVMNRVHRAMAEGPSSSELAQALSARGLAPELGPAVERAFAEETLQSKLDAREIERFQRHLAGLRGGAPLVTQVPALAGDVHDFRVLFAIAEELLKAK
ncbi:MAG TPA: ArsA-related P-loop ATPase [Polyangiaceae bacterium]|nr:ArsA-related P-loop ATPase [Polyangiaceae bacterium]